MGFVTEYKDRIVPIQAVHRSLDADLHLTLQTDINFRLAVPMLSKVGTLPEPDIIQFRIGKLCMIDQILSPLSCK